MKILIASTPATGHLNPLLAIGHILVTEGHQVAFLSGSVFRDRILAIGSSFHAFPAGADFDPSVPSSVASELESITPGADWLRVTMERMFVDAVPAQHQGLQKVLQNFPADVVIGDDMLFGVLPMLLGPDAKRPPIVLCGTSFLHWCRGDGAPHFIGLPPAITQAQRDEYAQIYQDHDRQIYRPVADRLNRHLEKIGVEPLSMTLFDSIVYLADAYIQLTVPSFEFPREIPSSVHFVGTPPIVPNQAPLPPWAHELDGSRKVVLVTTVGNHNFDLLITPTLRALANEPDVLVIASAGGRPIGAIPGPIPDNARLAQYLPFEWILPKTDVFVTNGDYGSVNRAMSFGVPLVCAGAAEDKADVKARVAWSGVGINLKANPTPTALCEAVRTVIDAQDYRVRVLQMAGEFRAIDTRSEILRVVASTAGLADNENQPDTLTARPALRRGDHPTRRAQPRLPWSAPKIRSIKCGKWQRGEISDSRHSG
jgi:UDP:flavonoid glycosyltransferase YjiC (YdhE family)